jgi:hypothetical protein
MRGGDDTVRFRKFIDQLVTRINAVAGVQKQQGLTLSFYEKFNGYAGDITPFW